MSEHTPGPWKVVEHNHACDDLWLSVCRGAIDITHNKATNACICASKYSALTPTENLANARLIAAAPELLEALVQVQDFKVRYRKGASTDELFDALVSQFGTLQTQASIAIALASPQESEVGE